MTPQKYNGSEMTAMNNDMPTKWITQKKGTNFQKNTNF